MFFILFCLSPFAFARAVKVLRFSTLGVVSGRKVNAVGTLDYQK